MSDGTIGAWRKMIEDKPRLLAAFLRLEGSIEMLAFIAAAMPFTWMAGTHRWLGLGELPAAPLMDYMIRSVSLLYGMHGVLLWFLAVDVTRYRALIVYTAISYLVAAGAFAIIDVSNAMPWWWTFSEVGSVLWLALLFFWLLRK
jgi:hypothetical protein